MRRPQEVRPYPIDMPDTEPRRLEKLQTELDNISKQYSSGKISKQEFYTRVRTIETQLMQYKTVGHIEEPLEVETKKTETRPPPAEAIIIEPPTSKPRAVEPPQPPQEPSTEKPASDSHIPPVTETVSTEPPKRVCIHCKEEIPPESIYCDRCGRYLGKPAKRS